MENNQVKKLGNTMELVAGLDMGNGYAKAKIGDQSPFAFPAAVGCVTHSHDMKAEDIAGVVDDIFNHLDITYDTPMVSAGARRYFGRRGMTAGVSVQEFDVYSQISKANDELSPILVMGTLAAKALQEYYDEHSTVPSEVVKLHARVALALPINEYKRYRKSYTDAYLKGSHFVTIHNFKEPVRFHIIFDDVKVFAEGQSAQYAIKLKGEGFIQAMLDNLRNQGYEMEGITAHDIMSVRNTVGVDIGEGTVNFPVFQEGDFAPDASITYHQGYGSVITRAMDRLQEGGMAFSSRKSLTEFVQTTPSATLRKRHAKVSAILEEETLGFASEINMEFVKILNRVNSSNEAVYVYGGGATPLEKILMPLLLKTLKSFDSEETPVLYLDSRYSRYLNVVGLYLVAEGLARKAKASS